MALTTKAEVKVFLTITDTSKDTIIDALIPAAQNIIEEYCAMSFDAVTGTITEYHDGGVNRVILKRYPLASTPAIVVYEDAGREFETEDLVDSDDYRVDLDAGIIYFDYDLGKGWGSIKVIYTPKFPASGATTYIPDAIKQACIELVAWKMKRGVLGDVGVVSRGMPGGTSVSFTTAEIPPEIKAVLDLFRSK